MKILFFWFDIGSGHKPGVNHGLASMAAYLRSHGHTVAIKHVKDNYSISKTISDTTEVDYDVIGFSVTTNQFKYFIEYSNAISESFNGLMIAGGVHPTLDPSSVMESSVVHGVCLGEGEYPLGLLADKLDAGESHLNTPSFWWRDGQKIIKNEVYPLEHDLSKLPLPDYSDFHDDITDPGLGGFANIMISRGCPYNCTYCCNHALKLTYKDNSKYFRMLSVDRAMLLLKDFIKMFPLTKGFIFEDDLLVTYSDWFREFGVKYKKEIGLPYICNGRFEHVQKEEVVQILKDSGCTQISFGLESGDEDYRKNVLKRGYSDKHVYHSAELLKKAGVPFFTYNILGFPLESKEQMQRTVSINMIIRPNSGMAFFFYPYPGTDLYDLCVENDLLDTKKMDAVSGYREKPVIKLPNCSVKDCVRLQHKLMLFFIIRRLSRVLNLNSSLFDKLLLSFMMIYPSMFIDIFTRDNFIKKFLRKLQYKNM